MNVKELIEILKKYNEDSEIYIGSFYDSYHFCMGKIEDEKINGKQCIFLHEGKQVYIKPRKDSQDLM